MEPGNVWQGLARESFVDPDAYLESLPESDPWGESVPDAADSKRDEQLPEDTAIDAPIPKEPDASTNGNLVDPKWLLDPYEGSELPDKEDFGQPDWDEPEPLVDADTNLSESLYPADESVTDMSLQLKIGEALAQVAPISNEQYDRSSAWLRACGVARLRRILPWLRNQTWSGTQLCLFLEFRNFWESPENEHLWESFFWSEHLHRWMPRYNKGYLSLDHVRELVQNRSHCTPQEVIDEDWFQDWEDFAVWKLGIRSFASFAAFRASLQPFENWRDHLYRRDNRTELEIAQWMDQTYEPFMLPSCRDQFHAHSQQPPEVGLWWDVEESIHRTAAALGGDFTLACERVLTGLPNG